MTRLGKGWAPRALLIVATATLSGCLEGGDDSTGVPAPVTSPPVTAPQPDGSVPNTPPEIAGNPPPAVVAGELYSFTPEASDADNDFLEFSIENKPDWAEFSTETGELSGLPPDDASGPTEPITISVTDGRDTRSITFSILIHPRTNPPVADDNEPPVIEGEPAATVRVGATYEFQPTARDADGDELTFSISGRPSWLQFDAATGKLWGTPEAGHVGRYRNIVVSVSDGVATASLPAFSIRVLRAPGADNRAPSIAGSPGTTVQAGQRYTFQPTANDPDNDALEYHIENRPGWATFDRASGRLSGTPTSAHVGTYPNIVISVTDGSLRAALPPFSITVTEPPNRAPTISGTPATSVTVGANYSFQPTAADPDDDKLGFTIQNKPSWASFDTTTGRLSGTPASRHVGTTRGIVISVSDGKASASLRAFDITVRAPTSSNPPPPTNRPPTISGTAPTSATVGSAYVFQPRGDDPDGDALTFSISNKPAWASFDPATGRLSGTPQSSGTYSGIVISVSDGQASAALPAFQIVVTQPTVGRATLSWMPPTQNTDGSPLNDLAGYRIVYGTNSRSLDRSVQITNPSVNNYVLEDLGPGTWYFAVKAYNTAGIESELSNIASKTIR